MIGKQKLTREQVLSMLDYDPVSGDFTWKWREGLRRAVNVRGAGKPAGTWWDGYLLIMINGYQYRAHRLAYLIMTGEWPLHDVDHQDRNRSNNAWKNIRPATKGENLRNRTKQWNNTSGFKGVGWHSQSKKWRARINVRGQNFNLGLFDSLEDAAEAYRKAAIEHHGSFACFD